MVQEASLGLEFKPPAPIKKADMVVCTPAVLGNAETESLQGLIVQPSSNESPFLKGIKWTMTADA